MSHNHMPQGSSRRNFLGQTVGLAFMGISRGRLEAQPTAAGASDLLIVNGKIHTMDSGNRVVSQALVQNGRFTAVANNVPAPRNVKRIDVKGKTVLPGIIDAHNHIVLVGNRPGWHTPLEHVFTIPDAISALKTRSMAVPAGEFITTVGPVSAMQFAERRLPSLADLDAVNRPVYIQAAQGGARTNSQGKAWFEMRGVTVAADGTIAGAGFAPSGALLALRKEMLTPESRKRSSLDALNYYARLGITTHRDCGAFHSDEPSGAIATENTFTMHNPFLALHREGKLPTRLRIDFLEQDSPTANPPLPTLSQRLKNSFPFFGDEWIKTGGIGEFTGGGIDGLRAIAKAGWRAEDHALNLAMVTQLVKDRETVNAEIPISGLRWIISHIPEFPMDLANRMDAMGMGVLVGWGPLRGNANAAASLGPPYRMLMSHRIKKGYHSDGGDITAINPWLNFFTMTTGLNLAGQQILGDQTLTRQEAFWLATAANKWFLEEDDLGSIETGNHGDLVVLDRDCFTVSDEDLKRTRSLLTVVAGKAIYDDGVL